MGDGEDISLEMSADALRDALARHMADIFARMQTAAVLNACAVAAARIERER